MRQTDRNFDDLFDRFEQRVYNNIKGEWRLKLLKEDLLELYNQPPQTIWDAGCGFAQISQWFAANGHQLTLCDLSEKMLQQAKKNFDGAQLKADFYHGSAQQHAQQFNDFDVVLFHAVLEWLADPLETLTTIAQKVKTAGHLSLLFYNRNAMVYSNTLKGGWRLKPIIDDSYLGVGTKLTPPNPQYPHQVIEHMLNLGFEIKQHTGIRVFHDYMSNEAIETTDLDELFKLEYRYCRQPTYRDMGRYVHILLQKVL
jgi:S-adenosylmethionine-dependent methyltransferase